MTESDITRILVAIARIEGRIDKVVDENDEGKQDHVDFELRLRALEKARWIIVGAAGVLGSGVGAALSQLIR